MQNRSSSSGRDSVARTVGQTFATLQHLMDLTFVWGSRKLKQVGGEPAEQTKRKGAVALLKRSGRATARFLGTMGDAYYEWYERLKARKMKE
ncbi:MAG TPA: hypothetical protein DEB30_02240 [Candidatus Peribacter riflensis]|uniref:Uncharacterized protein n=1 Tax=Candidatus Peribacter riflensis TaxID=1735162 RepID=A0A0S1SSP3_9BACT|nr:MAG: hypothetical protein PeribacterA2_0450 [Candidatus Peribacter riflensis]OGJ79261.1 MAG: hypothetical protein A2398_00390 [Candidatus Peribacteria bacterium RIFOXYB1_FULL_57_12]OGJ80949.1 MAG: hypothetical protein A2412_01140 [Candidatus Peribacteria bacterium RIFOXYC1_FULL_58_8]ALM10935.1 MAG: hypothetical protein PeribacterB2_0449 [Candidatus Peribacter riflensis]ALM12038.1 MAG: hypothetical protein PeribacterC2_0449 [Candidatus Peribacter riflensis]